MTRSVTLYNGDPMPILGLGTYRMRSVEELRPVVREAIKAGYRLIDSATVYRNEEALGIILDEIFKDASFGIRREDLFITSKLSPQHQGYDACYKAVLGSLERLGLDYLDLYLIHWPGTAKKKLEDPVNKTNRRESYRALEALYHQGKIRHVGVSNYTVHHLEDLLQTCTVVPHVHQFELHPRLMQEDVLAFCSQHAIQVQAYSSLGEGRLLSDSVIIDIAAAVATRTSSNQGCPAAAATTVTPAGVLLRWAVQHGWAVIPKSSVPDRVRANADIFSFHLTDEEVNTLDKLQHVRRERFCWDPTHIC
ncbi:NADP-dependent oxidoreductase domain-containing protein [Dichotomocladium elegans]|nr:NADP-dependent oxidoreductase domain-containing protein [Dichotomocladium elegans]